ncbi:elongation of very long chain fatty acids protein 7-like [Oppia nitens]|uniref:elongation of very long chain fatty acids protein 7-like n=1 Tax=Oppia nitens TaxID=1686743 RepID=UPI0023DAA8B9|nr:elongation of very long chain fatty acids protein 7-like [Oppia nitens]
MSCEVQNLAYVISSTPFNNNDVNLNHSINYTYIDETTNETGVNIIQYIVYDYWINKSDERVDKYWLFGGGPQMFALILFSWLVFVVKIGPNLMKTKQPFVLREIMMAYNLIVVVINIYAVIVSIKWLDFGKKTFEIELLERNNTSDEVMQEIHEKMIVFYSKLIDLFDTIFFVLRKKSNQISFLHLYHHFMVPVLGYMAMKTGSVMSCVFGVFVIMNSTVHIIMYSYYFLAAFGPKIQPYLWWKRYITQIQLIQFVILIIYAIYVFIAKDLSQYPDAIKWTVIVQPFIFFYMFLKFYLITYKKSAKIIKNN